MQHIPLIDLQRQYRLIRPEIDRAVQRVLASGQFILGPEGEALEREVARACGTKHAVAVASGTDALILALRASGIGKGDEVITSAFSFFATAEAIIAAGAVPVFADIDPATCTLDPEAAASRITRRTQAILPVHLYGHPCDMDRIMAVARAHKLRVIEDCAQSIGARWRTRPAGSFGVAGCLSFYPTKNLGGAGDGGMVVTNDAAPAEQVRLLRAHGSRARYRHLLIGANSRLDELQAAILRVKLRRLDAWTRARRAIAQRYTALIRARCGSKVQCPVEQPNARHVYHLYTIRSNRRDRIQRALAAQGIATQVAYPSTLPAQPALAHLRSARQRFPRAEAACREVLSLPIYPELTSRMIARVVDALAKAC